MNRFFYLPKLGETKYRGLYYIYELIKMMEIFFLVSLCSNALIDLNYHFKQYIFISKLIAIYGPLTRIDSISPSCPITNFIFINIPYYSSYKTIEKHDPQIFLEYFE